MRLERACGPIVAMVLLLSSPLLVAAQSGTGTIRGEVLDASGAVVPGVTVEAVANGGQIVGTTVTDGQGGFALDAIPYGVVIVRLTLDGFETASLNLEVLPAAESWVSARLRVAPVSERVEVRARAPQESPRAPAPRALPVYEIQPVALPDMESVCGPAVPGVSASTGTIRAHRQDAERVLYRLGDELTLDPGAGPVLSPGQNLVARRYFRTAGPTGAPARGEHTAGVVQVVSVNEDAVTAVVIHACGELRQGDLLAPFIPEPMPAAEPVGTPVYRDAARILFGDAGQLMGAPGRLMVIDRGQIHGVRAGQRLTLFRRTRDRRTLIVGEAIVLAVREDSARIRVEHASDAIWFGDSAAPHAPRPPLAARRGAD